jgi:hypothetical protein
MLVNPASSPIKYKGYLWVDKMKEISLTQGKTAFIDDDDFHEISKYKWFAMKRGVKFHACRNVQTPNGKRLLYLHHAVVGKPPKGLDTDHIDGNGLNNCKSNLRMVTRRQNMQNVHIKNKTSIFPGVSWCKEKKKWSTAIQVKGVVNYIGRFNKEIDAYVAYCSAVAAIGEQLVSSVAPINSARELNC